MAFCSQCGTQIPDGQAFCPQCGAPMLGVPMTVIPDTDHTEEFTADEVADGKLLALAGYAMGVVGLLFIYLSGKKSAYLDFHAKQILKIAICSMIVVAVEVVLSWTLLIPVVGIIVSCIPGLALLAILVLDVMCFIKTARNQSVDVPLIYRFDWLN